MATRGMRMFGEFLPVGRRSSGADVHCLDESPGNGCFFADRPLNDSAAMRSGGGGAARPVLLRCGISMGVMAASLGFAAAASAAPSDAPAPAPDAPSAAPAADMHATTLEEVVITAQKRLQNLKSVP